MTPPRAAASSARSLCLRQERVSNCVEVDLLALMAPQRTAACHRCHQARSPRLRHERVYDRIEVDLLALRYHARQHRLHLALRKAHGADLADDLLRAQLLAALGGAARGLRGRRWAVPARAHTCGTPVATRLTQPAKLCARQRDWQRMQNERRSGGTTMRRGKSARTSRWHVHNDFAQRFRAQRFCGEETHRESWPLGWRSELPLKPRDMPSPDGGAGALAAGYPW